MTATSSAHTVKCPHGCTRTFRILDTTPGGVYVCALCRGRVMLSWATWLAGGRRPYLVRVGGRE